MRSIFILSSTSAIFTARAIGFSDALTAASTRVSSALFVKASTESMITCPNPCSLKSSRVVSVSSTTSWSTATIRSHLIRRTSSEEDEGYMERLLCLPVQNEHGPLFLSFSPAYSYYHPPSGSLGFIPSSSIISSKSIFHSLKSFAASAFFIRSDTESGRTSLYSARNRPFAPASKGRDWR